MLSAKSYAKGQLSTAESYECPNQEKGCSMTFHFIKCKRFYMEVNFLL